MQTSDEFAQALLERVDRISREISKVRRAIEATQQGIPFNEAFDDEIFTEGKQDKSTIKSELTLAYQHLLKLRFARTADPVKSWYDTVMTSKRELSNVLDWDIEDQKCNKNLMTFIEENLGKFYSIGISLYKKDSEKHVDLRPGIKLIPKECPWALNDILREDVSDLIRMIDPIDDEDRDWMVAKLEKIDKLESRK